MRHRATREAPPLARRARLPLAWLVLCVTGCSAPADPSPDLRPLAGEWTVARSRWVGGALSGPLTGSASLEPAVAHRVAIEVFALDVPLEGGRPLASVVRLGADLQGSKALGALSPLLTGGRLATGAEAQRWERQLRGVEPHAGRWARLGAWEEPLVAGGTLSLSVGSIDLEGIADDFLREFAERGPFPRRVDLLVALEETGSLQLAVALKDRDRADEGEGEGPPRRTEVGAVVPVGPADLRRDLALVSAPPADGGAPVVALLPSPFRTGAARWLAISTRVLPGAIAAGELDRATARFERAHEIVNAVVDAPSQSRLEERNALEAIRLDDGRRAALLFLGDRRGAAFASELALGADDALLERFAARIEALGLVPAPDLGWRLERAAIRVAASMLAEDELASHLRAGLLRRAGQAGLFPGVLEELAVASRDLADFEGRLVAENRLFLEDSDPGARVRAYDWLAERRREPEGYDPLASRDDRRAVLRALRREAEAREARGERRMEASQ